MKPVTLNNTSVITDITDGTEYVRVNSRNNRQKYDSTLILNTDGPSLVKSSSSHCWPLLFTIAEIPDHLRESFLVTIGLWCDNEIKPLMNTFLLPFVVKLRESFYNGIRWTDPKTGTINVLHVVAPLIIADAPARAQVQNILNYNG